MTPELKTKVKEEVDSVSSRLIEISDWMYENPEYSGYGPGSGIIPGKL